MYAINDAKTENVELGYDILERFFTPVSLKTFPHQPTVIGGLLRACDARSIKLCFKVSTAFRSYKVPFRIILDYYAISGSQTNNLIYYTQHQRGGQWSERSARKFSGIGRAHV